jgi:hypothetical protein
VTGVQTCALPIFNSHAGTHIVNTTAVTHTQAEAGEGAPELPNLISAHATANITINTTSKVVPAAATLTDTDMAHDHDFDNENEVALSSGSGRLFLSHWDATGAGLNHSSVSVTITLQGCDTTHINMCAAAVGGSTDVWMIDGTIEAKSLWYTMGQPAVPTPSQLQALKTHSEIKPTKLSWTQITATATATATTEHGPPPADTNAGVATLTAVISMPPNSACVVTL